jgi:hypothetical protein
VTGPSLGARRDLLVAVLDTLVPPDSGFPGAGAVALEHVLAVAAASPEMDALLAAGLDAVAREARAAGAAELAWLGADEREAVLRRAEASHPVFFDALVGHAYDGYYSDPAVIARLGLDPSPLHPRGHRVDTVETLDLARVRARGRLYRPA